MTSQQLTRIWDNVLTFFISLLKHLNRHSWALSRWQAQSLKWDYSSFLARADRCGIITCLQGKDWMLRAYMGTIEFKKCIPVLPAKSICDNWQLELSSHGGLKLFLTLPSFADCQLWRETFKMWVDWMEYCTVTFWLGCYFYRWVTGSLDLKLNCFLFI